MSRFRGAIKSQLRRLRSSGAARRWYSLGRARWLISFALLAVVLAGAFGTASLLVHGAQVTGNPPHRASKPPRPDPKAAGKWFVQSHFGNKRPAPNARILAYQQAAKLPHSLVGARAQQPHGQVSTGPGSWSQLGPEPISTASCYNPSTGNGNPLCDDVGDASGRVTSVAAVPAAARTSGPAPPTVASGTAPTVARTGRL